jgi:hypothetical protein
MISRRNMLTATATGAVVAAATAAGAASFGNPDEPPQGAINAKPGEHYRSRSTEPASRRSVSLGEISASH